MHRQSDVFLGQEHSIPKWQRKEAKAKVGKKWTVHFTELDEELEQVGGLFAMARGGIQILTPKPKGPRLKELNGKGRVQTYGF